MLHDQKLQKMLELINQQPYWTTLSLAQKLGISRSTAQKCLDELHKAGFVDRVHGGVKRKKMPFNTPVPVDARLVADSEAKSRISSHALTLVPEQGYIYIDAGTTTLPLVQKIAAGKNTGNLMIITNDVQIAILLAKQQFPHILLGGNIHPVTQSISGVMAIEQASQFQYNLCVISVDYVSPAGKTGCALLEEAKLKSKIIGLSEKSVLLTASGKFKSGCGAIIADLKQFNCWITDTVEPQMRKTAAKAEIEIIQAK